MGYSRLFSVCVTLGLLACSTNAAVTLARPWVQQGSLNSLQGLRAGGAMAAGLSSNPWDGSSASLGGSLSSALSSGLSSGSFSGSSSGSMLAAPMDRVDELGRPVALDATPLESQGVQDPLDAGDSQSFDSSSLSSALSSGSLSGSLSGSSFSSSSASGSSSGSCGAGPCGGGAVGDAKIVGTLTSGGKKYVSQGSDKIWSFGDNAAAPGAQNKNAIELAELEKFAAQDPELQLMIQKLNKAKQAMENEKNWVEDVKNVITHYRAKIGAVTLALKQQAKNIWTLKAQIIAKRKLDARKLLEQKLASVQKQLQTLQNAASNVSGEARNLTQLKGSLSKSIESIQGEISKLRGK